MRMYVLVAEMLFPPTSSLKICLLGFRVFIHILFLFLTMQLKLTKL